MLNVVLVYSLVSLAKLPATSLPTFGGWVGFHLELRCSFLFATALLQSRLWGVRITSRPPLEPCPFRSPAEKRAENPLPSSRSRATFPPRSVNLTRNPPTRLDPSRSRPLPREASKRGRRGGQQGRAPASPTSAGGDGIKRGGGGETAR